VLHVCHFPDFELVVAMGWEPRERGGPYYTRSRRVGGRVVREYVGAGPFAELAAAIDALKRCQREEKEGYWQGERERLEQEVVFLRGLEEAAEIITQAQLIADGCHKHKGSWRRSRETSA
jgi:hypothetical protein